MKKLLSRWKLLLGILVLLLALVLPCLQWWLNANLTPEKVVKRLEAKYNLRAEIDSVSVSILSSPAKLTLKHVVLVPRDAEADAGKPLAARSRVEAPKKVGLGLNLATAEFSLWQALLGNFHIENVVVDYLRLNTEQDAAGVDGFSAFFKKPHTANAAPEAKTEGTEPAPNAPQSARKLAVNSLSIKDFRLDSRSLKKRQTYSLQDASLNLSKLRLSGSGFQTGTSPQIKLNGRFLLIGKGKAEQLNIALSAELTEPISLDANSQPTEVPFTVKLGQGSKFSELPAIERMNEKMKRWEKYYLVLQPLPSTAAVLEDSVVQFRYTPETLTNLTDLQLNLDAYQLLLKKNSLLKLKEETCQLELLLTGSPAASQQIISDFRSALTSKLDSLGATLHEQVIKVFRQENLLSAESCLTIPMTLTGPTGKPEVEDNITDILKDALWKSLLSGS